VTLLFAKFANTKYVIQVTMQEASAQILSRIYNVTKPGNRPIGNATTAHFTLHVSIL